MTVTSCGPPVGWPKMKKKKQERLHSDKACWLFSTQGDYVLCLPHNWQYILSWWRTRDASKRPFSNITICTHHMNRQGARQLCIKSSATWAPTRPSNVVLPNASQHLMCTFPVRSSENTKPVGRPPHKQNMQVKNQDKIPKTENLERRFQGNEHIFNNTTRYETLFSCHIHNGRTDQMGVMSPPKKSVANFACRKPE